MRTVKVRYKVGEKSKLARREQRGITRILGVRATPEIDEGTGDGEHNP